MRTRPSDRGATPRPRRGPIAVKSQIHAGGRGKGTSKAAFRRRQTGKTAEDVYQKANRCWAMCCHQQTGPKAGSSGKLIIAAAPHERSFIWRALTGRPHDGGNASTGWQDIEEVAANTPESSTRKR